MADSNQVMVAAGFALLLLVTVVAIGATIMTNVRSNFGTNDYIYAYAFGNQTEKAINCSSGYDTIAVNAHFISIVNTSFAVYNGTNGAVQSTHGFENRSIWEVDLVNHKFCFLSNAKWDIGNDINNSDVNVSFDWTRETPGFVRNTSLNGEQAFASLQQQNVNLGVVVAAGIIMVIMMSFAGVLLFRRE